MTAKEALPYGLAVLALALAGYFFYETKKQNAVMARLITERPAADGKKQVDPYLAGPVKNRILKRYPEIQSCYKAYTGARKSGDLRIDWQIDTSGRALNPEVVLSQFGDKAFEQCVTGAISKWRFPEPMTTKYVEHTFHFKDASEKPKK